MEPPSVTISISQEFLELYPHAKEAILFFETHEGKMAPEAIIEFRDALDHLMMAFSHAGDEHRAQSEITSAFEHLRRASIEPFEWAVENKVAVIWKRYRWTMWGRILMVAPPERKSYYGKLAEIKNEILAGRKSKNAQQWKEGIEHFIKAYTLAAEVEEVLPEKQNYYNRIFQIMLATVFFLLGKFACN